MKIFIKTGDRQMKKLYLALAVLMTISMNAQAAEPAAKPAAAPPAPVMVAASAMPEGNYVLDPSHASITWRVNHLGTSYYTARFGKFDAKINFNPKDLAKSSLEVKVDPNSIRTDYNLIREGVFVEAKKSMDFDKELSTGEKWFNAAKFPDITFVAKKIKKTGDKTGVIMGDLTMMGVTKPVELKAVFNGGYVKHPLSGIPVMGFSATASIKRSDWGLAAFVPKVADKVDLIIEAEFEKRS